MKTLFPIIAMMAATPAYSADFQDLVALERRLVIALGADIGAPGGPVAPLDRRMKLAACPGAVAIDPPAMGAVALRCKEIGWRIRVPLTAGGQTVAMATQAKAEKVVRRGDPVELSANQSGFTVSTQTIAEQDGAIGERIRVRADRTAAPLMVEVVDFGKVRLPGFNGI
jgi:flagella basal body P-ring formation protein FlgA